VKSITLIDYQKLKQFEDSIGGNVKVGGYEMDKPCPVATGNCYQIELETADIDKIFLLNEKTFTNLTSNRNYKLSEIVDSVNELERVNRWVDWKLNLRDSPDWSPVFVSQSIENGSLITIDGNHRLVAHFLQHRNVDGVHAYLFVHHNINEWVFIPALAK
jgi:hypothetical protein